MLRKVSAPLRQILRNFSNRRQVVLLSCFVSAFIVIILLYSVLFQVFMAREGQDYSWVTGLYWTLTVMSTLGFGDITFHSDIGRLFTIGVLSSGVVFLLIFLPLLFMEGQSAARVPRELPKDTSGHVILLRYDEVTQALISRLNQYHYAYVLLAPDLSEALRLHDLGLRVVMGATDLPETFARVRVD